MEVIELDSFFIAGVKVVSDWRGLSVVMPKAWQHLQSRLRK